MKRMMSFLLILSLLISALSVPSVTLAEGNGTDYSWLDDMTINQLKELDKEIHKRIPYGGQESEMEPVSLPGTWYVSVFGIDCYAVLHEDGTCVLVSSNGSVCRGTYIVTGRTVMISSEYMHALAGTWEISGDQLVNSMLRVAAVKTDKPVRYASSMDGNSMNDILEDGDTLLVEYREPSELKLFDLVLVNYPGRGNTLFTKRLIGLPGDKVELRDGYLILNEEKYEEPYINENNKELDHICLEMQYAAVNDYLTKNQYVKLLTAHEGAFITLLSNGWRRIDDIQQNDIDNKNVFVAMSFADSAMKIREAIRKGIIEAGFSPEFMDEIIHNNQIVPEMFRLIRECRLLILDISEPNYGAYYEAGYARGLGKDVIISCSSEVYYREYHTEEEKNYERYLKPHFDIAQNQILVWNDEKDLIKKLSEWIKALIR